MSLAERQVEPEILDALPSDDPAAIRSRKELRRINWVMAQARVMARALAAHAPAAGIRSIVDLGSGDGTFMLAVARLLARRWPAVTVTLLDRQTRPSPETIAAFAGLGWTARAAEADAIAYLKGGERFDAATANLFLHHFNGEPLAGLLRFIAGSTNLFVACEPARSQLALLGSRLVWFLGSGPVTRHDAVASVRAGFSGKELSARWPADGWRLDECRAGPFAHRFVATRVEPRR